MQNLNLEKFVTGIAFWLVRFTITTIISLLSFYGTYIAAYSNFQQGMLIFWVGCVLHVLYDGYWIYRLVHTPFKEASIYFETLLSIIFTVLFGYGGTYLIYKYGTSPEVTSNLAFATILSPHVIAVLVLTGVVYSTLQIIIAVCRSAAVFYAARTHLNTFVPPALAKAAAANSAPPTPRERRK